MFGGKRKMAMALINDSWWDGFWEGIHNNNPIGGQRCLTYTEGQDWLNPVADLAHKRGYQRGHAKRAEILNSERNKRPVFDFGPRPDVETIAECLALAGVSKGDRQFLRRGCATGASQEEEAGGGQVTKSEAEALIVKTIVVLLLIGGIVFGVVKATQSNAESQKASDCFVIRMESGVEPPECR